MAYNYNANQFDSAYKPEKLGNWEIPRSIKLKENKDGKLPMKNAITKHIVDDNGHLLPGIKKINNSFLYDRNSSNNYHSQRWPENAPNATMGYKGNQTHYLPSNTVTFKD